MIRATLAAIILLAGAALAAGCSTTHAHTWAGTSIDEEARRGAFAVPPELRGARKLPRVGLSLRVVPASVTPSAAGTGDDLDDIERPAPVSGTVIREALARLFTASGVFDGVVEVKATGPLQAAAEARRAGASFLIEAIVRAPTVHRVDRELLLPLLVYIFPGFPCLWMHNETYRFESEETRLRLHDLNTDQVLPERFLEPARAEEQLNLHERTDNVGVYFLCWVWPTPFIWSDIEKVGRVLAPAAVEGPARDFLQQLVKEPALEAYSFTAQRKAGGEHPPTIAVAYPPTDGTLVHLVSRARTVRYLLELESGSGSGIQEVRVNGRRVFPMRQKVGLATRPRLSIGMSQTVAGLEPLLVEVTGTDGARSACTVTPMRAADGVKREARR